MSEFGRFLVLSFNRLSVVITYHLSLQYFMGWRLVVAFTFICLAAVSGHKLRVAVVGFQKNEVAQLDFWLAYHVALFGKTNIAVLDNYSSDNASLVILQKWVKKGVHVLYDQGPYGRKGDLNAAAFRNLFPKHQLLIPLDVDEILVSYRDNLPVVSKKLVHGDLDRFWASGAPCAGLRQYYTNALTTLNDTVQSSPYFNRGPVNGPILAKKIVRSELLVSFDHGNHVVWMKPHHGQEVTSSNCSFEMNHLGLLHYAHSEPIIMLQKAILDCIGFGYFPSNMTAENFRSFGDVIEGKRHCAHVGEHDCVSGRHKLKRAIYAFDHGVDSLFSKPGNISDLYRVGNFAEILAKVTK